MRRSLLIIVLLVLVCPFSVNAQTRQHLRFLEITTEAASLNLTTGGLALATDPNGLLGEFAAKGISEYMIVPRWSQTYANENIRPTGRYINVPMPWGYHEESIDVHVELYEEIVNGVHVIYISEPNESGLFNSLKLKNGHETPNYSGTDKEKAERFGFFARAVLEVILLYGKDYFDVVQTNDWMSGLVQFYAKTWGRYSDIRSNFFHRVHSFRPEAQGIFPIGCAKYFQIDDKYLDPFNKYSVVHFGSINLSKAAAMSAGIDHVFTVDEQTALDARNPNLPYGYSMQGIYEYLNLKGIGHGVDLVTFNPYIGNNIKANYDAETAIEGKDANLVEVQSQFGLPVNKNAMLFVSTSRISHQKSHRELALAIDALLADPKNRKDMQFIIMGDANTNDGYAMDVQRYYEHLQDKYPENFRLISFEANKAKQAIIVAAADALMLFSLEEPRGIDQLIALIYGTLPIVNPVNGLRNTIAGPNDPQGRPQNGIWLRGEISSDNIIIAIKEAITLLHDPVKRLEVIKNMMSEDLSWSHKADQYIKAYLPYIDQNKTTYRTLAQLIKDCPQRKWTLKTAYINHKALFSPDNFKEFISSSLDQTTKQDGASILTLSLSIWRTLQDVKDQAYDKNTLQKMEDHIYKCAKTLTQRGVDELTVNFEKYSKQKIQSLNNDKRILKITDYLISKNGELSTPALVTIAFGTKNKNRENGLFHQLNYLIDNTSGKQKNVLENKMSILSILILDKNKNINGLSASDFFINELGNNIVSKVIFNYATIALSYKEIGASIKKAIEITPSRKLEILNFIDATGTEMMLRGK